MSYILPWTYITCIIILVTTVVISISDQLSNSPCFQAHPSIFKNLSMLIQRNYKKQWLLRLFLKLTVQNLAHTTTTAFYWGPGKYEETFRQHDTVKGKNQTSILVSTSQQDSAGLDGLTWKLVITTPAFQNCCEVFGKQPAWSLVPVGAQ